MHFGLSLEHIYGDEASLLAVIFIPIPCLNNHCCQAFLQGSSRNIGGHKTGPRKVRITLRTAATHAGSRQPPWERLRG